MEESSLFADSLCGESNSPQRTAEEKGEPRRKKAVRGLKHQEMKEVKRVKFEFVFGSYLLVIWRRVPLVRSGGKVKGLSIQSL